MLEAKIQKLFENAHIPTKAHPEDAAFDLYAYLNEKLEDGQGTGAIPPGQTCKVGTGIAFTPPQGYFGAVFARSGLATKQGLRLANSVAVIDPNYTGELIVPLHNDTDKPQYIAQGDRIAQLMFLPVVDVTFDEVDERLKKIMINIFTSAFAETQKYGKNKYDLLTGANIAGFKKVATAMLEQGI